MDLTFTEYEKSIIEQMINAKNLDARLTSKYFLSDDYVAIEISDDFSQMHVVFNQKPPIELQMSSFDRICELIFLFNKLESSNLIGFVYHSSEANLERSIYSKEKYTKSESYGYTINMKNVVIDGKEYTPTGVSLSKSFFVVDADIAQKIYRYANSWFYISSELKELVKNNFKTPEQLRHKHTSILSAIAIVVAITIGLLGNLRNCSNTEDVIIKSDCVKIIKLDNISRR